MNVTDTKNLMEKVEYLTPFIEEFYVELESSIAASATTGTTAGTIQVEDPATGDTQTFGDDTNPTTGGATEWQ